MENNKTKLRTVPREGKWERKEYIATCDSNLIKDIIKNYTTYVWTEKEMSRRE